MKIKDPSIPTGPIPGANYTSDTRNWPWHRPPDITDIDEGLEHIIQNLTETPAGKRYMGYIEGGTSIASVTDMIVTLAVGRGKFTPDFAILLAGPTARLIEILTKSYGIDYEMGIERDDKFTTAYTYKKIQELNNPPSEEMPEDTPEAVEAEAVEDTGLMAPVPEEEQASMLGYDIEEELEDE